MVAIAKPAENKTNTWTFLVTVPSQALPQASTIIMQGIKDDSLFYIIKVPSR